MLKSESTPKIHQEKYSHSHIMATQFERERDMKECKNISWSFFEGFCLNRPPHIHWRIQKKLENVPS